MECAGIHHVGLWVDDVDEMVAFLVDTMGFHLLSRNPRGSVGVGERLFIQTGENQLIELLTEPNVQPRPDFPLHPVGHVGGIPHLCLQVTALNEWRERLQSLGYPVSKPVPEVGFMDSELGTLRLAYFEGPGGVGFELFEFEN